MDQTAGTELQRDAPSRNGKARRFGRALGLGLITGAADDDPSAIGAYASAGAAIGTGFLWVAPVLLPMTFAVVYLSAKLGQVSGRGLFRVMRDHYGKGLLYFTLAGALIGNTVEAAADLGGMAAALNLFVPLPIPALATCVAAIILGLQIWGSYVLIRNLFRWLALALLAYVVAALMARPDPWQVLRGTFVPHVEFTREYLTIIVAAVGSTLSAYIYSWQSNEEVEEMIAEGKTTVAQRRGATDEELRIVGRDVGLGMIFSNLIMYFIILSTAATLHPAGKTEIGSAVEAAQALQPVAGEAAGLLFLVGMVGVGFLAVPVMTAGAAYDLAQCLGWRHSLHATPTQAKKFYAAIVVLTVIATGLNFLGVNPMKALVWAGVVQGVSTPPLLALIVLMTNNPSIMGEQVNGRLINALAVLTVLATSAATLGLAASWFLK